MAATEDPREAALAAGLHHVRDEEPGIRRVGCGRGFRYLTPAGTTPSARVRERIDALVIPPAWTDVWICGDADGHIQATGRDEAGRKQYRYHDAWQEARQVEKFDNLAAFGRALTPIRAAVAADLNRRGLPRAQVLALVVRLLDVTLIRIGNEEYARQESFGLTTLQAKHVDVESAAVTFDFQGKQLVDHHVEVVDRRIARLVAACDEVGGDRLFSYDLDGQAVEVSSSDVNDYLHDVGGPTVTARDFRTWGGTVSVVEVLGPTSAARGKGEPPDPSDLPSFLDAVDVAAERLGNTRAVCRSSYVHPVVEPALHDGRLATSWARSRRSARMTRAERATLRLLATD